jgi:hypothetical protein
MSLLLKVGCHRHVNDHIAGRAQISLVHTMRSDCSSLFFIATLNSSAHARIKITAHYDLSASLLAPVSNITQLIIKNLNLLCRLVLGVWCIHRYHIQSVQTVHTHHHHLPAGRPRTTYV